jgi:hypothetical protein
MELYRTKGGMQEVQLELELIQFWHLFWSQRIQDPDKLKYRGGHDAIHCILKKNYLLRKII